MTFPLRTLFFGTPEFAAVPLQALIESEVADVIAVICQPDKPRGRGQRLSPPPTKVLAEERGIPVLQPPRLRGTGIAAELAEMRPDIAVVAAYGKILPRDVLDVPRHGCINIHASLLPKYRGAAPIQWSLINGERETGITIMQMDEGCDTGPIIAQEPCEILVDDDALSLSNMLSVLGGKRIVETLEELARHGRLESTPQDDSQATKAPLLKKEDGIIHWFQAADAIACRIRGVTPWPGAQTTIAGKPFKILAADPIPAHHPDARPGEIVEADRRRGFVVATGDGFLLVRKVQPAGRKPMSGGDAVNGGHVGEGVTLTGPAAET
ncbi:methionyl-tRNA formyltransferase [Candidatus Sumerlaeota bacterium]|nr:methionyl-tRNA formyltransferase [Candidatus Sumerlaeota bacterium]